MDGTFQELLGERPLLVVVSGPSGSGKTTIVEALRQRRPIRRSVSATTRPLREGEINGVSYHFLTEEEFRRRVEANGFAEWAQYRGYYYGTLRETVESALRDGKDVVLTIDVQGGAQIRARYREAVLVFILPPDMKTLADRLAGRGTESEDVRRRRLEVAGDEIRYALMYDYAIVNEESGIEQAAAALDAILRAEKHRITMERAEVLKNVSSFDLSTPLRTWFRVSSSH